MSDTLPYPENEGQTHFEGCYCVPHHHNCAVHEVLRLQSTLLQVQGERDRVRQETIEEAAKVCDREHDYRRQMEKNVINNGGGGMGLEIMHSNKAECSGVLADRIRALGEKP